MADVALQLGAVAIERGVVPVIFSYVPWSGFEQYGFRVEKIHTPAQLASKDFEAELCAFWNISFVIDVSDVRTLV
ncbi:hypothetical protein D9R08_09535 [Rhodophyticola porphyridii]|uniref:Uncharacterized protein n=1 Tax=Rhodophyticola porphyridii TaxID=1852017 RepID=A0A3L9Y0J9_9RHOB|nr:hypothetical protein D9R08_09535 [Rhodophyticola porphyridii]